MRKTFPLEVPGRKSPRVIDSIKSDARKYIKRERRKELPEGVDFLDFDCRVGTTGENAVIVHVSEISAAIETASKEEGSSVYVEILAKPGYRTRRVVETAPEEEVEGVPDEEETFNEGEAYDEEDSPDN